MNEFVFSPIGFVKSQQTSKLEAPRQGVLSKLEDCEIHLNASSNFEQALEGLQDFERVWLIYVFDRNTNWKPMVSLPRAVDSKKGVFATRSPYRPNSIGMSCVLLKKVEGLKLHIAESDLLDGTPILDIKPYIDYSDSFITSLPEWLSVAKEKEYRVIVTESVKKQFDFISKKARIPIQETCEAQLANEPTNKKKKRVEIVKEEEDGSLDAIFSYKTWRVHFSFTEQNKVIVLTRVDSGYSKEELEDLEHDPYLDKKIHLEFLKKF